MRFFPLYAIKTISGSDKAPLEGGSIEEAKADYDELGRPAIKNADEYIG